MAEWGKRYALAGLSDVFALMRAVYRWNCIMFCQNGCQRFAFPGYGGVVLL